MVPMDIRTCNLVARNLGLANLRPPPEQLQLATTFILQQLSTFAQFIGISEMSTSNFSPLATLYLDSPAQSPTSQSPAQSLV
jgi:hypothetical protein